MFKFFDFNWEVVGWKCVEVEADRFYEDISLFEYALVDLGDWDEDKFFFDVIYDVFLEGIAWVEVCEEHSVDFIFDEFFECFFGIEVGRFYV